MPAQTQFDSKTVPFINHGIAQRVDPGMLGEGQFVHLRNMTSVQEGALEVRQADKRVAEMPALRNSPHSFARLRTGEAEANNYMYVGEGADILRGDGNFGGLAVVNTEPLLNTPIRERVSAVNFSAGFSGKPYVFFASPKKMYRDKYPSPGTLQPWGLFPPTAPAKVALGSTLSKSIVTSAASTPLSAGYALPVDFAVADGDMSRFSPTIGSGLAENGYDSEDFVKVQLNVQGAASIENLLLQFDVSTVAGQYVDRYEVSLLPLGDFSTLASAPPTAGSTASPVARIRKSAFSCIGAAGEGGTTGRNWRNVQAIRVLVQVADGGVAEVGPELIAIQGGYGPDNNKSSTMPYFWVYCYRDPETGQESNPSVEMIEPFGIVAEREPVTVTVLGTDQPAIPVAGVGTIAVYRRGGVFDDNAYRLVGYVANPGAGSTTTFTDTVADADIASADQLQVDNDPPVTSSLPSAVTLTSVTPCAAGQSTALAVTGSIAGVTKYSRFWLRDLQTGTAEEARVSVVAPGSITLYCQYPHSGGGGGLVLTCYAAVGKPCRYAAQVGDAIYLAGDDTNPHILYRSKRGKPDAWPVKNQIPVGSPSNPIQNLTEFNGEVVVFTLHGIYVVRSWTGDMMPPLETPAQRGLLTPWAWAKGDNELFYLANDGIYSWSGGQSQKITEDIDWMFKNRAMNGLDPIDLSSDAIKYIQLAYYRNELRVIYRDVGGYTHRLRYRAQAQHWEFDDPDQDSPDNRVAISMYKDEDRARLLIGKYSENVGYIDAADQCAVSGGVYGATDGFSNPDGQDGLPIPYGFRTGVYTLGGAPTQKLFSDIVLELESTEEVLVKVYYDFADVADVTDTFTLPGGSGRRHVALPLQQSGDPNTSEGKQAHAISFEISGVATHRTRFFSVTFVYAPLAAMQRGKITDWEDLGYNHDKRLEQLVLEYDLRDLEGSGDLQRTVHLDVVWGIGGATVQKSVTTFTLGGTGKGRTKVTLPIKSNVAGFTGDKIICKMVRLRPEVSSKVEAVLFEIFHYEFIFEKFPPDITYFTDPSDLGYAYDKYLEQLLLEVDTGGEPSDIEIYVDSGVTVAQTLTNVSTTYFDRRRALTLTPAIKGRMVRMIFKPAAGADLTKWKFQLYNQQFIFDKADKGPVIHTNDWDDLGYEHDKRLYLITAEYEVTQNTDMNLTLLAGLTGNQSVRGPYTVQLKTGGRRRESFALPDTFTDNNGTWPFICKMVNFQPASTNTAFRFWKLDYNFDKLPPDVVRITDYNDFGTPYEKLFQQLVIRVDTGGVQGTVILELDGQDVFTGYITTQSATRDTVLTLPASLSGRRARLRITPGGGGKFQMWDWTCIVLPADKGPVAHTGAWDSLDHNYDKRLTEVTVEYDCKGSANVPLVMDTITGLLGNQTNLGSRSFTLAGPNYGIQTFPIDPAVICKMIRLRPFAVPGVNFKMWKYQFTKTNFPPDIILATEWSDYGWPFEKILKTLSIEVNTGGVPATLNVEADGAILRSFTINTTIEDRYRVLTLASDVICRNVRLTCTPGPSGYFQLFSHKFDYHKEPAALTRFDTYEQCFGSAGWKTIKQIWLQYQCLGGLHVTIYRDKGQLFHELNLPAHEHRDVERFYLPDRDPVTLALNKSKLYRIIIDALDLNKPFKLYRDASRIETIQHAGDMRAAYYQNMIYEGMELAI